MRRAGRSYGADRLVEGLVEPACGIRDRLEGVARVRRGVRIGVSGSTGLRSLGVVGDGCGDGAVAVTVEMFAV